LPFEITEEFASFYLIQDRGEEVVLNFKNNNTNQHLKFIITNFHNNTQDYTKDATLILAEKQKVYYKDVETYQSIHWRVDDRIYTVMYLLNEGQPRLEVKELLDIIQFQI